MHIEAFKNIIHETYREIHNNLDLSHLKDCSAKSFTDITASVFRETVFTKLEKLQLLNFHDYLTHVEGCPCVDTSLQYAFMQIYDEDYTIMSAEEFSFYNQLCSNFNEHFKDLPLDRVSVNRTDLKLVYGGILCKPEFFTGTNFQEIADFITSVDYVRIERDIATLCECHAVQLYPDHRKQKNFIPFVALMSLPFSLDARNTSITLTPLISPAEDCNYEVSMWEYLVHRPFIMACRAEGAFNKDFLKSIVMDELINAYNIADIYS